MAKTVVPVSTWDARLSKQRFGASPRTAAVPVLPAADYGTEAWRKARLGMIGASEMAAVLGLSPYASPFSLWWAKQEGWSTEQTMAMYIGHKLELVIAELFAEARPDVMVCASTGSLWRHPEVEWMGATPDYLAITCDHVGEEPTGEGVHIEPVECKSDEGGDGWGKPGTDEVPAHHRVQVLQQCAVFGAPRGHLVRMAGKRFSAYVVEYDPKAIVDVARWTAAGAAFITSLETGVPPDVDDHKATTDALRRMFSVAEPARDALVPDDVAADYERLNDLLRETKRQLDRAKNQVRDYLGEARYGLVSSTGRRFVDRRQYKRSSAMCPQCGYSKAPTTVDALYPVGVPGPKHAAKEES